MTQHHNGSRIALPPNAQKCCASCLAARGNTRRGWEPITRDGLVVGWTCPACPTASEPIRRVVSNGTARFAARLGVTGPGSSGRKQVQRSFADLGAARAWVAETREAAKDSRDGSRAFMDPSLLTVRKVCESWLAHRATEVGTPGGIRSETANGYASALSSPLRLMGDRLVREVTADDVEAVLRAMVTTGGVRGRPLSHRSATYALLALRLALDFGVRKRWLPENVARLAKVPGRVQGPGGTPRARLRWTPDQLKAFRAHVDQTYAGRASYAAEPWVVSGMRLTLCGLRRSEVLGLDWSNVDVATGAVTVAASRTKTGRSNTTELNGVKTDNSHRVVQADKVHAGTAAALRELWLAQGRPGSGLVIRDSVGQPVQPDAYSRKFKALCVAAGVPSLARIHNVRHSVATALQEAGVPHNRAAALLGHDVQTYLRFYVVADNDAAAEGAEAAGLVFAV